MSSRAYAAVDRLGRRAHADGPAGRARVRLGVDVRYDSRVLALIADEADNVHGVVVRINGQTLFARARRGVVLCAGGFVMNRDMVRRHAPPCCVRTSRLAARGTTVRAS